MLALWIVGAPLWAADRLTSVEDQIVETEQVLAQVETPEEEETFQTKLDLLKRERDIILLRRELQDQESNLQGRFSQDVRFRLNDYAQTVILSTEEYEEELEQVRNAQQKAIQERTGLENRIAEVRTDEEADANEIRELEMRLDMLMEEIRAMRLREDLLSYNLELIQEGERVAEMLRTLPINPKPVTRGLFRNRRILDERRKQSEDARVLMETLDRQRREAEASLELFQAQQAAVEDEINVLDSRLSRIDRLLQRNEMLSRAKLHRRLLGRRIEAKQSQLGSIRQSTTTLQSLRELLKREVAFLEEHYQEYTDRYLRRILMPISAIGIMYLVYLLFSRLILPIIYQKDELFNARRLGGYVLGLGTMVVIALFFFDDLQAIATVFGIAGAALVIALQDMLSSIAGWFVIVSSRKAKVGDRVEVDGHRGDIIDIQLMRTTIVEVNQWLGVDQPTGRIVAIPNSFIFKSSLVNYSHMHRYLWGTINVLITFESSVERAREVLKDILESESRPILEEARAAAMSMEQKYGVADTVYEPKMYMTVEESGINFRLLYIAHYKHVSSTESRISERIARAFEADDPIAFAYPTVREIQSKEEPRLMGKG
jgi:small-conductance mechanosensitive channel